MEDQILKDKIKQAIESAKYTDWGYNGDDEYPIACLDEDQLLNSILEIIKENNGN